MEATPSRTIEVDGEGCSHLTPMFTDIQRDPDVCSNCFRRTHDRFERNYRLDVVQVEDDEGKMRWTVEPVDVSPMEVEVHGEVEEVGGYDDDVYRLDENTTKIPEKGTIRGMTTICECGFRYVPDELLADDEETWKNRPLAKSKFFEYAEYLVERFEESGASFNEEEFFDELDRMKSDPNEQFADDRIYRKAFKHASSVQTIRSTASDGRGERGEGAE